jgi:RHS repeat-associated protein
MAEDPMVRHLGKPIMQWLFAVSVALLAALPAAAQCNVADEPHCIPSLPPDVIISPDGGVYESAGTPVSVEVSIAFSDGYGLNASSRQVRLLTGSTYQDINFTWSSNSTNTHGWMSGTITLPSAGDHTLTASIKDIHGYTGSMSAVFRVNATPVAPVATLVHHNEFRDLTLGSFVTQYAGPSYVSMNAARGAGFLYVSETANPSMFVQVDAKPDARNAAQVTALSLRIEQWTAGPDGTHPLIGREYFQQKDPDGRMQRLAAQWPMAGYETRVLDYWAVVRAYLNDGSFTEKRLPIRVLVVNESGSRYGAGWVLAGVQRIYNQTSGVLLTEGNGAARWFTRAGCGGGQCSFTTPAGDFSTLTWSDATASWTRKYVDGTTVTFDSRGLQTRVADRFGIATTYEWILTQDGLARPVISRIVDPLGHATSFTYHTPSWMLATINAGGRSVSLAYNDGSRLTNVTGLGGEQVRFTYGPYNEILSHTTLYGTVSRGQWDIAYDAMRRVSTITGPPIVASGANVRPVTKFRSQQVATVLGYGVGTTQATAAPPLLADTPFVEVTDPGNHTTKAALDLYGNPLKAVDSIGQTYTATYNTHGQPLTETTPTTNTTHDWYASGYLHWSKVNGVPVYEAFYDSLNRKMTEGSGKAKQWFAYGPAGEVTHTWTGEQTDESSTSTWYTYNGRYQVVRIDGPKGERVEMGYDGNVWRNTDFVKSIREDGTILTTSMVYDALGRTRTTTDPLNEISTFNYDDLDRVVSVVDTKGRAVRYFYTGPHQTQITDRAGKSWKFQYNALGWLMTETFPDLKKRTYRYDIDGLLIGSTDRRNLTVTRTYDAGHRLYDLTADGVTTTYRYPDVHTTIVTNPESEVRMTMAAGLGMAGSVSTTLGGRRYELAEAYDETDAWRPIGTQLRAYAGDTLLRTHTYRQEVNFNPTEPWLSAVLTMTDMSGRVTTAGIDNSGRLAVTNFPNGVAQYQSYTTDGRLTSTTWTPSSIDNKLGNTFQYETGNRINYREAASGQRLWAFGYSPARRLNQYRAYRKPMPSECTASGCPNWVAEIVDDYSYDPAGNRTDRGAVLEASSNRYTSFNGVTLQYDAEGNITRRTTSGIGSADVYFTWDSLGQLDKVVYQGLTIDYGYDGLGRRVRRTANGETQYSVYDGDDLVQELDTYGNPLRTYTYWPGIDQPLSVRSTIWGADTTYYYALEAPGHVIGLTDGNGALAATYRYAPYGKIESSSESNYEVSLQPLRYMARELDPVTGLYYVRNRWYDPVLARFISEDPIGLAGGLNTYEYVGGDPISRRDPTGLWCCDNKPPILLPTIYATYYPFSGRIVISGFDASALMRAFHESGYGESEIYMRYAAPNMRNEGVTDIPGGWGHPGDMGGLELYTYYPEGFDHSGCNVDSALFYVDAGLMLWGGGAALKGGKAMYTALSGAGGAAEFYAGVNAFNSAVNAAPATAWSSFSIWDAYNDMQKSCAGMETRVRSRTR